MNRFILAASMAVLFAGALAAAAGATIQRNDGRMEDAFDIQAETISGIIWESERGRPGTRVRLWELDSVRYTGPTLGEFNALPRRLSGGISSRLRSDAQSYLKESAPSGFSDRQWNRMKLSLRYFEAMADYLEGNWAAAIKGLEDYMKECEKPENLFTESIVPRVSFASAVSGKTVTNAGGLNRYYLDALEALGLSYLKQGNASQATAKAFTPMQALTEQLARNSGDFEYFDWGIRALRASADYAVSQKDYKGARESYQALELLASKKNPNRPSRLAHEAKLKVGYMQIKEGDTRGASARFYEAVSAWERDHGGPDRPWQPRSNWIDDDSAYMTAGSYLGQGLVKEAEARRLDDWAEALTKFSTSLAIFNADDELRSIALLGAANAAAQLAELNKDNLREVKRGDETVKVAKTSDNYARLSEKYLSELTTLLPKTKAAEDEKIADIQKLISAHRHD